MLHANRSRLLLPCLFLLAVLLAPLPAMAQTDSPAGDPEVQAQIRLFSAWLESH